MTPRYFGGEPRNMGLVSPLPQSSFEELAKEVFSHPITLPLTRAQFWALPDKDANAPQDRGRAKRTRFLTPGVFSCSNRKTEHVQACNLVFLDIDDAEQAFSVIAQKEELVNVLAPYSFLAYYTASSTPESPRLRVVVDADNIPPASYLAAVSTVAAMLGLRDVTRETKVLCQPMFLPTVFRGDTQSPLIAEHLAGRPITVEDLQQGEVLDTSPSRTAPPSSGNIDLDHLRPPVEEINEQDAREALEHLNPDMPRPEWVRVGAALRHQFQDAGLALWREWSAKGQKYEGEEELEKQWRSLRQSPRGRLPVTIRSVLKLAAEAGWESAKIAQKCYDAVNRWLDLPEHTETVLLKHAVNRIAAAPLLSHVEKGALLNKLASRLKTLGVNVTRTDLNRQFRSAQIEARGKGGDEKAPPDTTRPAWAMQIVYVSGRNEFHEPFTGQKWTPEALDNTFSEHLMVPGDTENGGRPPILPRHYLLNVLKCSKLDGYLYLPSTTKLTVEHDQKKYINTYRMTYPEPDYKRADEAGALVKEHCRHLFNTPDEAGHVLDWLSYLVQNQGAKILWAILMQGAEGCGKSFWFEAAKAVLGETNAKVVSAKNVIHSNWTEWAADVQLVHVPEIRVVGESRHAVMDKLKPLVSDKSISIEQRNTDTRTVPNYGNYFLTTNFTDALAITQNDRRYYVVFSKLQSKQAVRRLREAGHFTRLFDMLRDNAAGLRAWLLQRRISDSFDPVIAPDSRYKSEMLEAAASPLQQAVETVLRDGDTPLARPDLVSITALRDAVEQFHHVGKFSDQAVAAVLREMGLSNAGRHRLGDVRHSLWFRPGALEAADAPVVAMRRFKNQETIEDLL